MNTFKRKLNNMAITLMYVNLMNGAKYVVRNKDGGVLFFKDKPEKMSGVGWFSRRGSSLANGSYSEEDARFVMADIEKIDAFESLKWSDWGDDRATEIDVLIKKTKGGYSNMRKKDIMDNFEVSQEIIRALMLRVASLEEEVSRKASYEDVSSTFDAVYREEQKKRMAYASYIDEKREQLDSDLRANTDGAGAVTLQELASLVIDGKPLKRVKTTVEHKPIEVGAFVPKAEEAEKNPA